MVPDRVCQVWAATLRMQPGGGQISATASAGSRWIATLQSLIRIPCRARAGIGQVASRYRNGPLAQPSHPRSVIAQVRSSWLTYSHLAQQLIDRRDIDAIAAHAPGYPPARHHRRIGQRRGIAQAVGLVGGDLAQDAAHDLAAARLRQRRRPLDRIRRGDRADLLAHPGDQFLAQLLGRFLAQLQRDIGVDALALQVVREAHHRGLGHLRMRHQRAFHFRGAHAMARHVDHVIDAAGDPVIAVLIAPRAVAGEIQALEGGEIGLHEPLVVAEHGAHHAGPGIREAQIALARRRAVRGRRHRR